MGQNSHRSDINEDAKPWASRVTIERYDFSTLTRKQFIKKYSAEAYERIANGQ